MLAWEARNRRSLFILIVVLFDLLSQWLERELLRIVVGKHGTVTELLDRHHEVFEVKGAFLASTIQFLV